MADADRIVAALLARYPDAKLALNYSNALELLVAVLLSAQCTDARVNQVTAALFRKYRTARDFAEADPAVLAEEIRPTGFYRNKTRLLIGCCRRLLDAFGGDVPQSLDAIMTLPGVGRKTANMVLGNAYGIPGIAVDTHVLRVSSRLGLAAANNPEQVEAVLMTQVPQALWVSFTNALILHGREVCTARHPRCGECVLFSLCEWPDKVRYTQPAR